MMPQQGPDQDDPGMHKERMKDLGLSKEQMQKLEDLRQEHQKFMNTKRAEIQNLQIDKENAMESGAYDKAKGINKQISDLELAIANAKVDHHQIMMKELTKEQQEKFRQMMHKKGGPQLQDMGPVQMEKHKGPRK
jgi:Spy/CpxP family protein refolding chaperone